jgi:O-antigen/teichoic acid export membrane protein
LKNLSLYFSKAVTTGSTFVFNILLAKVAGVDYFGIFGLFATLTFIINYFADWGVSVYGPLALSQASDSRLYVQRVFRFKVVVTIFFLMCYLLLVLLFYGEYFHLLGFGVLVVLSSGFNFDWLLRSLSLMHLVALRQIFHALFNLLCAGFIVYFNMPVDLAFAAYGSSILVSYLFLFYFLVIRKHLTIPSLSIRSLWVDTKSYVKTTRQAFLGLLLFNLLYALNVPFLTYFTGGAAATQYISYYTLFSSVAAVMLIAQDIYFPQYRSADHKKFMFSYTRLQIIGGVIVTGVLLCIPYYFPYIYPSDFSAQPNLTAVVAFLGIIYCFRLFSIHQFLLLQQYKRFFMVHLIGLAFYLALTTVMIYKGQYTPLIAFVLITVVELFQIFGSLIWLKQRLGVYALILVLLSCWVLLVYFIPSSIFVFVCLFICIFLAGILFLKRLLAPGILLTPADT